MRPLMKHGTNPSFTLEAIEGLNQSSGTDFKLNMDIFPLLTDYQNQLLSTIDENKRLREFHWNPTINADLILYKKKKTHGHIDRWMEDRKPTMTKALLPFIRMVG